MDFIYNYGFSFRTFKGIEYFATTADCWSSHNRSFLGMTVHWVDPVNRERKHAVLACRRLKGSHTFDVLAEAILDVHKSFGIEKKVIYYLLNNIIIYYNNHNNGNT